MILAEGEFADSWLRDRSPALCDVCVIHEPDAGADRSEGKWSQDAASVTVVLVLPPACRENPLPYKVGATTATDDSPCMG